MDDDYDENDDNFEERLERLRNWDNQPEWDNTYDWEDVSFNHSDRDDGVREKLEAMRRANKELGYVLGAKMKAYTDEIKNVLGELGINVRKGDGPNTKSLLERIKLISNKKGKVNDAEFDGVKIIISEKGRFTFSKNVKFKTKIEEFDALVLKAKEEHEKTAVGFVEKTNDQIPVDDNAAESVLSDSIEEVEERISNRSDRSVTYRKRNKRVSWTFKPKVTDVGTTKGRNDYRGG